jgi:hypothetical protein
MHANRLLRSAQREQEAVLYDFLARYYESDVARKRRDGSSPVAGDLVEVRDPRSLAILGRALPGEQPLPKLAR